MALRRDASVLLPAPVLPALVLPAPVLLPGLAPSEVVLAFMRASPSAKLLSSGETSSHALWTSTKSSSRES